MDSNEREFQIGHSRFTAPKLEPGLYLAATPIGNLKDITLRVLEAMSGCDVLACEDTRVTSKLLRNYAIHAKTISYNEHNAEKIGPELIEMIQRGLSVVLASDAGTPLISDPGFRLVEAARSADITVVPLPGASAPLTALVASGLTTGAWTFGGFLPHKQGQRMTTLKTYQPNTQTLIFFENPNRLLATLRDMISVFGEDCVACVARELTKLHEDIQTATLAELERAYSNRTIKGEIVILISGVNEDASIDSKPLLVELLKTHSVSRAAAEAAELTGQTKRDLYQLALKLKDG